MGQKTSTHVANGYHKTIYVKCDAERRYVTMESFHFSVGESYDETNANGSSSGNAYVSGGGSVSYDWNKIKAGFAKILPQEYLQYDVDCSGTDTVYITVVAEDGELICDAFPKTEDYSVMIDSRGQLKDVEYGKIWQPRN